MSEQTMLLIVNMIGLVLTGVGLAVTGTWQLGRMSNQLSSAIAKAREEIDDDLKVFERNIGEALSAIRQKVNDVELDAYKTFVRRESFYEVINQFKDAVEARMDKFEGKLDKIIIGHRIDTD